MQSTTVWTLGLWNLRFTEAYESLGIALRIIWNGFLVVKHIITAQTCWNKDRILQWSLCKQPIIGNIFCEGFQCLIHVRGASEKPYYLFCRTTWNWNCKVAFAFEEEIKLSQNIYCTESAWQILITITCLRERYEFRSINRRLEGFYNKLSLMLLSCT